MFPSLVPCQFARGGKQRYHTSVDKGAYLLPHTAAICIPAPPTHTGASRIRERRVYTALYKKAEETIERTYVIIISVYAFVILASVFVYAEIDSLI